MYRAVKRVFDILFALILIPFVAILYVIVGLAIKLEDGGPVIYKAPRIGQFGKLYNMFKFRSMKVNAPDIRLTDGSTYNGKDDPRVTKVGRFIRETSIDELPQIFNILLGQMSFIGPRPDPPDWMERYPKESLRFLNAKPGITGYSQAYYRNSADSMEKIWNDVYYADNISLMMDIKILFKTVAVVLKRENIYRDGEQEKAE